MVDEIPSHPPPNAPASVFSIGDDGPDYDDDLAHSTPIRITVEDDTPNTHCKRFDACEQKQGLLHDAAERTIGTAGCCGAFCMLFGCVCCGMCWGEFRDTYNRFTFCGLWCPVRRPH
jgi:hypothetical protein